MLLGYVVAMILTWIPLTPGGLGFVEVGPRRFGDDDCVVMAVTRERWSG